MRKITDYNNFWVIWLSCAGHKKGITLYTIQNFWEITTNYLYHKEARLKKPLFQAMIDHGYIKKEGKKIQARFSWISNYMIESYTIEKKGWSPGVLVLENWPLMQHFIEKENEILFNIDNLKALYRNLPAMKRTGCSIFTDIFLLTLVSNINTISEKYKARVVESILYTMLSFHANRDLFGYFERLQDITFPSIMKDEREMLTYLRPLLKKGD